jgi:hypothetical protein
MNQMSRIVVADLAPCAAVIYPKGCAVDDLLRGVVERLCAEGRAVAGAIQQTTDGSVGGCESLLLREIGSEHAVSITENRGSFARGCKLDPSGLTEMASRLEEALEDQPDLLVISRFGKAEIEGRGFRAVFSEALLRGIPVLTAVREINAAEWADFHQGLAVDLPPHPEAVLAWARAV